MNHRGEFLLHVWTFSKKGGLWLGAFISMWTYLVVQALFGIIFGGDYLRYSLGLDLVWNSLVLGFGMVVWSSFCQGFTGSFMFGCFGVVLTRHLPLVGSVRSRQGVFEE